jgi:hypothetical protein
LAESSIAEKNAGTDTKQRHAERTQGKTRKKKIGIPRSRTRKSREARRKRRKEERREGKGS